MKPTVGLEDAVLAGSAENFRYYLGGTATEISKLYGISLSLVESCLRRAKTMLKKELFELVEQTMTEQKLGSVFVTKVMKRITGLACINIPVRNVEVSARCTFKILVSSCCGNPCVLIKTQMRSFNVEIMVQAS